MIIHSLSADRARAIDAGPNRIEVAAGNLNRTHWIRGAYRRARRSGCSAYAARNLVWEVLFVAHLEEGGTWIAREEVAA